MSYAQDYVPIVGFATEESNSVAGRSIVRTVAVDNELANISSSINGLNTNLKAIQRDDGKLKDGLIEPYALAEQTRALIASGGKPRGEWQANTDYALGDAIQYLSIARLALSSHNSGSTFNSGLWLPISGDGSSATNAANAAASALSALTSASNALTSENNADISEAAALVSQLAAAQSAIDAQNAVGGNIVTGNVSGSINLKRTTVAATATTTPLWTTSNGNIQDWTGTPTITNFPAAPQGGSQRISYPSAGTIITHGGNISVQGNATYTVAAGDELTITAITTTTFYVTIQRKDGKAIVGASAATDTTSGVVELLTNAEYAAGTDTTRALTAAVARSNNLVLSTAQATTSGTSIDFTGIPSWVKRITIMLAEVSTNGTSQNLIQLGDAGGFENTTYVATASTTSTGVNTTSSTAGFNIFRAAAVDLLTAIVTLVKVDGNTWICSYAGKVSTTNAVYGGGSKTLSDVLTQVRITTVNGTDTFDAGSINIMYE